MIWGAVLLIYAAGYEFTSERSVQSVKKEWSGSLSLSGDLSLWEFEKKLTFGGSRGSLHGSETGYSTKLNERHDSSWDMTLGEEWKFTRGRTSSGFDWKYEPRKISYDGSCKYSNCKTDLSNIENEEAKDCVDSLPPKCFLVKTFRMYTPPVKPYEGSGSQVQAFSGFDTFLFDNPFLPRIGTLFKVPGESVVTVYLNENRESDCFLFLSASSPRSIYPFPLGYVEFKEATNIATYTFNEQLIASLYNMGEFDLYFIDNHPRHPCGDNHNIASIRGANRLHIIEGAERPQSLDVQVVRKCVEVDSTILEIDMRDIGKEISKLLHLLPQIGYEVPFKLSVETKSHLTAEQIANWKVYKTYSSEEGHRCSMDEPINERGEVWYPITNSVSKVTVSGPLVEVDLPVYIPQETEIPTFIRIKIAGIYSTEILSSSLKFGVPPQSSAVPPQSSAVPPQSSAVDPFVVYDSDIKVDVDQHSRFEGFVNGYVPITLPKPTLTTREFGRWVTTYKYEDNSGDCIKHCSTAPFFECRSKCNTNHTPFYVSRSANFSNSELPRLWGAKPRRIFGYAVDLALPLAAVYKSRIKFLKVTVTYKAGNDECQDGLMGSTSLNVPQFTPSVYFNEIKLTKFNDIKKEKTRSHYTFDVKEDSEIPHSIVIGYYNDAHSCLDQIESIFVNYGLRSSYTPPILKGTTVQPTSTDESEGAGGQERNEGNKNMPDSSITTTGGEGGSEEAGGQERNEGNKNTSASTAAKSEQAGTKEQSLKTQIRGHKSEVQTTMMKVTTVPPKKHIEGGLSKISVTTLSLLFTAAIFLSITQ